MKILSVDGHEIIVDEEDYDVVSLFNWTTVKAKRTRYAQGYYSEHGYQPHLHAFLMEPEKGKQVDHINGNGLDCRRSNMRIVTPHQNSLNRLRDVPRTNNHVGVYKMNDHYRTHPWYSEIKVCGKKYRRSGFRSEEEACMARNDMISQYITML